MLKALQNQLVTDLKANWQKSALLGLLLMVGFVFWIPPLLRMVSGSRPSLPALPPSPANAPVQSPISMTAETASPQAGKSQSWEQVAMALDEDAQASNSDFIAADPFQVDHDQFSPPLLFEDESAAKIADLPSAKPVPKAEVVAREIPAPAGLILKSTIVSDKRRAAYINSQVYYEGQDFLFKKEAYHLEKVLPRKVLILHGKDHFELEIPVFTSDNESGNDSSSEAEE